MALTVQSSRLSFGDESLHLPERLQSQDTLAAFSDPSYASFYRALDHLSSSTSKRFISIEEAAHSRAELAGDSSLKVVKRQYDSVKNTYMNLDIKDQYTDALLEGRPSQENPARLAEAEEATASHAAALRSNKELVTKLEVDLQKYINNLAALCTTFGHSQEAAEASLNAMAELEEQAALVPLPPMPVGPDEAGYRASLAAEANHARTLEASLANAQAETSELRAAVAAEEDEVAALKAQVQAEEAALKDQQAVLPSTARFGEYLEWCEEHAGLMSELSGISILNVGRDVVKLRVNTIVNTAPAGSKTVQLAEVDHLLLAHMDPATGCLLDAEAAPAGVALQDIVAQADGSLAFLVQAFRSQTARNLYQDALATGMQ